MIANKEYIAEILEEIIEFNPQTANKGKDATIYGYVVIVEQASYDLNDIRQFWNDKIESLER